MRGDRSDPDLLPSNPGTALGDAARRLAWPVYVPFIGMSICLGMVALALPLYLGQIGLGFREISVVLSGFGFGSMVSGVAVGDSVARFGERSMLVVGVTALLFTTVALAFTDDFILLTALQLASGAAVIAFRLSGQTWVARSFQPEVRGRLLSAIGGIRRFGMFVGPFLAGLLIDRWGFAVAFSVAGVAAGLGLLPLFGSRGRVSPGPAANRQPLAQVLSRHWKRLLIVASGPMLIMAARRGRVIVLPLIGDEIGLQPVMVGVVVSISTGADLLLFPVAGIIMDRLGRLWAIVPAFGLMGLGLVVLALVDGGLAVAGAGAVIGVGNGLSAGTMMTIAADLAPDEAPSQFMAGFASLQDWGQIIGPLLVGWVAAGAGLSASAGALALAIFVGVGLIVGTVGETGRPPIRSS